MQNRPRPPLLLRVTEWLSTPLLYALMLGIIIRTARRPPAKH